MNIMHTVPNYGMYVVKDGTFSAANDTDTDEVTI